MKKNHYLRLLLAILFVGFTTISCEDEPEMPGQPEDPQTVVNTTIEELIALYDDSDLFTITEDVVIKGIVTSSDEAGNVYKKIFIQDESGFGIQIGLNATGLYQQFPIGTEIIVDCQNLQMGTYGGLIQLGQEYEGNIGRIEEEMIDDHISTVELKDPIEANVIDLDNLPENVSDLYSTWVKIENVQFNDTDADQPYGDGDFLCC